MGQDIVLLFHMVGVLGLVPDSKVAPTSSKQPTITLAPQSQENNNKYLDKAAEEITEHLLSDKYQDTHKLCHPSQRTILHSISGDVSDASDIIYQV